MDDNKYNEMTEITADGNDTNQAEATEDITEITAAEIKAEETVSRESVNSDAAAGIGNANTDVISEKDTVSAVGTVISDAVNEERAVESETVSAVGTVSSDAVNEERAAKSETGIAEGAVSKECAGADRTVNTEKLNADGTVNTETLNTEETVNSASANTEQSCGNFDSIAGAYRAAGDRPEVITDAEVIDADPYNSRKANKKKRAGKERADRIRFTQRHPFFKKAMALVMAAVIFGVVASVALQIYRYVENGGGVNEGGVIEAPAKSELTDNTADGGGIVEQVSNVPVSSDDVSVVAENVTPAVVSIECKIIRSSQNFFGMQQQEGTSNGTGFIIGQNNSEILIATNNHVISGAVEVKITFADMSSASAVVKGFDEYYDLAVLSVDIDSLSDDTISKIRIATLGDSDSLKVGMMTIAIGNALGYGQSLTVGRVSALDREITVDGRTMVLLQTDAAINPGNSGGPLLNINGQVIGINTVKYSSTDVEGIGYAIPISEAIPIINELMNREELSESDMGYIGITVKDIEESYANSFNMPHGVYVYMVEENSPAEQAGIVQGDIVAALNSRSISSMAELQSVLKYTRAGTEVELKVYRMENGEYEEKTVTVKLGERP